MINTEDYLKKKKKEKIIRKKQDHNMFENDKQKLKERQKNLNRCMSQKGLRQRTEHFIENIKELLTPERFKK